MSVLHTWGSALTHHPHVHMVVPGGGLSRDGSKWIARRLTLTTDEFIRLERDWACRASKPLSPHEPLSASALSRTLATTRALPRAPKVTTRPWSLRVRHGPWGRRLAAGPVGAGDAQRALGGCTSGPLFSDPALLQRLNGPGASYSRESQTNIGGAGRWERSASKPRPRLLCSSPHGRGYKTRGRPSRVLHPLLAADRASPCQNVGTGLRISAEFLCSPIQVSTGMVRPSTAVPSLDHLVGTGLSRLKRRAKPPQVPW